MFNRLRQERSIKRRFKRSNKFDKNGDSMISFKFNQVKFTSSAFICVLLLMFFSACSEKINDYYSGIVIDELGRPVEGVLVKEDIQKPSGSEAVTDKNGFFKFFRNSPANLILSKNGYLNDTLTISDFDFEQGMIYSPLITTDSPASASL